LPSNNIYLWKNGVYDHSRWISIATRGADTCVLLLTDLCQPGKVSLLTSVTCPTSYLKSSVERGGSLQLTLAMGFLLIQRSDETLSLEFRGSDDVISVKGNFRVADVLDRIAELELDGKVAVTV